MSAAAAKPDEASSPDGLVDESEYMYFKTSFNKAALYRVSTAVVILIKFIYSYYSSRSRYYSCS